MKAVCLFTISFFLCVACSTPSRVVVKEKPAPPVVVVRPAQPYPNAVWVGDAWRWKHGRYVYIRPHYVKPKRGMMWVDGHWKNTGRGLVWVHGHWR